LDTDKRQKYRLLREKSHLKPPELTFEANCGKKRSKWIFFNKIGALYAAAIDYSAEKICYPNRCNEKIPAFTAPAVLVFQPRTFISASID
jgi:hypothetical protein